MRTPIIFKGGPRDGHTMAATGSLRLVMAFRYPADWKSMDMPEPLPQPETYAHNGEENDGRLVYVFVPGGVA